MNKSEIQARIEKVESELATLKAEMAKCDCVVGIEQEKCWHAVDSVGGVHDGYGKTRQEAANHSPVHRPAYMPECRQVTEDDLQVFHDINTSHSGDETAKAAALHKLGFRMKVQP